MSAHLRKHYVKLLEKKFSEIISSYKSIDQGRSLDPVDAFFAYRILLGRNPDVNKELPTILNDSDTYREFVNRLTSSDEFSNNTTFLPPGQIWMSIVHGFRFWFNTSDREMGVQMALGRYEPHTVEVLRSIVKPGMKCIDAGAHIGYLTCILASQVGDSGQVFAFEPMPSSYQLLVRNVEENHFENTVQHYQSACSDSAGTIKGSMVSKMYVAGELETGEKVTMETVRLDDIIKESIDIIKIDVEGHEPKALDGMKSIICKDKPVLFSEINEYWLRTCSNSSGSQYVRQLNSLGYDVYDAGARDEPIAHDLIRMDILDTMDVVAFPKGSEPSDYAKGWRHR